MKAKFVLASAALIFSSPLALATDNLKLNWPRCSVVEVTDENNHLLEEGLGSIYDVDYDGNSQADEDSTGASVQIDGSEIQISLGQGGWNSKGQTITSKAFTVENDIQEKVIELSIKDEGAAYTIRLLTQKKMGFVFNGKGTKKLWAVFDCAGGADLRQR